MPPLLRIDLTARSARFEELPPDLADLGGRGLTSALVARLVPPGADPLGPENVLVLAPGLLAGTAVPNSGRLSVGAKSPLTGTIKEANAGGSAAQKLARLGVAAVLLEGSSPDTVVIKITAGGAEFQPGKDLWGRGIYEVFGRLAGEHAGCGLVAVGPAGERGLAASAVAVATPDGMVRTAARGGLGAVMGRKGVKALVIDDVGGTGAAVAEPERFRAAAKSLAQGIAAHPLIGGFRAMGTSMLVDLINEMGGLPTRNYSSGTFEGAKKISGEALAGLLTKRPGAATEHRCMAGCIVQCSQVYTDAQGQFVTSGLEYETLGLVGSNCAIDDPDAIARIDRACDDLGLDTMEVGAALAIAMEAGRIPWGDGARALAVVESIRAGDPLGLLMASGCVAVGREFGVRRVPAVKGQSMAAYDPRVLKGTGVTYATSPMGADHTAGNALPHPGYDPSNPRGQAEVSGFLQGWMAAVDTLGLCVFASVPVMESPDLQEQLAAAVRAKLGRGLPEGGLLAMGTTVCRAEREFNSRAGFTRADDRLPAFFAQEALTPTGNRWDVPEADLDRVFG